MNTQRIIGFGTALLLGVLLFSSFSFATPAGASITSNSTDFGPTIGPSGIANNRSTITTVVLNSIQQNTRWKAYVGNVTGTFTLDDASNNTIYDWSTSTISGEVYASRNSSLDFGTVACATNGVVTSEMTAMNQTPAAVDSIQSTFNGTNHSSTTVAGTILTGCNMTTLYVSDASQGYNNASADFQEFLMEDANSNLAYVAIINDDTTGFDTTAYDFQMIVAEEPTGAANSYYFYVELG